MLTHFAAPAADVYGKKKKLNESVNESERIILVNELKMNESLERIKISTTKMHVNFKPKTPSDYYTKI